MSLNEDINKQFYAEFQQRLKRAKWQLVLPEREDLRGVCASCGEEFHAIYRAGFPLAGRDKESESLVCGCWVTADEGHVLLRNLNLLGLLKAYEQSRLRKKQLRT